jgi:membrane protein implicated in regulation of membrane protease activity
MKLRWGILGVGAACAACCIPLILPLVLGAGIAGAGALGGSLLLGFTLDQVLCVGLPLAALGVLLVVWSRRVFRSRAKPCGCEASCEVDRCAPR